MQPILIFLSGPLDGGGAAVGLPATCLIVRNIKGPEL